MSNWRNANARAQMSESRTDFLFEKLVLVFLTCRYIVLLHNYASTFWAKAEGFDQFFTLDPGVTDSNFCIVR